MFKFRFEKILKIRQYEEDIIKNQLALLNQELAIERDNLKNLYLETEEYNKKLSDISKGFLDINLMNSYRHYLDKLAQKIDLQKKIIIQINNEIDTKKKKLIDAMKKVKIMEKLKEKDFLKWKQEQEYKEEQVLDEIGTIQFNRKRQINEV